MGRLGLLPETGAVDDEQTAEKDKAGSNSIDLIYELMV